MRSKKKAGVSVMTKVNAHSVSEIIIEAGDLLLDFQKKLGELKVENKPNEGLVSNADKETEELLIKKLGDAFADSEFLAEEDSYARKEKKLRSNKLHWLIDPLDGTNNFLSGFDYFSISVATFFDGRVNHGWVYRPSTKEMFFAEHGIGSSYTVNGVDQGKIKISDVSLSSSMLTTGFCVEKGQEFDKEFEIFKSVMRKCRGVRRLGSAALDLCYSATGPWNGFWERGLSPWDVAAGALFVLESGGVVTNYQGEKFSPFDSSIVASSQSAHADFIKLIGKN